ncbi:MAG: apolipoprotein N-acyltransferase [Comamonadaceae bacterium]|nr:apolipoprotein N-acyltransferase [Comamonadaceae bacterium]
MSGRPPGREARGSGLLWFLVCLLAGALQAASLAWPLRSWSLPGVATGEPSGWLQIGSLALLALALRHVHVVGQAVWRGWVFATTWLAGTFWWLFVSMHTYGGLPAWLAVLAVLALAGALALYYALAAGLMAFWAPRARGAQALLFAALWTLAELMRGQWLTGFPWGAGGYAQVDLMAAWAPWLGVYGMGALAAVLAYSLAVLLPDALTVIGAQLTAPPRRPGMPMARRWQPARRAVSGLIWALVLVGLWLSVLTGDAWRDLGQRDTTSSGPLRVWLLQGNIPQDQKFEPGTGVAQALSWYPQQVAEAVQAARAGAAGAPQLVVAPETALPLLPQQLGADFWTPLLRDLAAQTAGAQTPAVAEPVAALLGLPLGSFQEGYTNSAWGITPEAARRAAAHMSGNAPDAVPGGGFYRYDKHHLVPFGEFIPPFFRWFTELMRIPLGDFSRGALGQPAWAWAGQRVAANICYEDLFGEELAASFADPATAPTVLVNLSNIGWFGDTVAIDQHLQISRLRTLELGRPMLRATNTGATAVIDHRGVVTHQLPRLTRDRLAGVVEGREGLTPYARWAARWGQWPVWGLCLVVVMLVLGARRWTTRPRRS